ncbi:MAG: hypothetical protein LBK77_06660 [Spirochaetaceae bacterium]|jgi:hypothetical protein|nr:hypothetical protein [Spirochaetaceae bacterium]
MLALGGTNRQDLSAALADLYEAHEAGRAETVKALELLIETRRDALSRLKKTGDITKNLNLKQRDLINRRAPENYTLEQIAAAAAGTGPGAFALASALPACPAAPVPGSRPALALKHMAALRKNLAGLGIAGMRAREMTGAIKKSIAAFEYQYRRTAWQLFPLGFLSRLWRNIRTFFGMPYFSYGDMGPLRTLAVTAGFVLKMAEAPVF